MPTSANLYAGQIDQQQVRVSVVLALAAIALVALSVSAVVAFAWPSRDTGEPYAFYYVGTVGDFAVGEPRPFLLESAQHSFWLVKGNDGELSALTARAPSGCRLPWREGFAFEDPRDGIRKTGWFRDPCHGSTYDIDGVRVFGPATTNLDEFPVRVVGDEVYVDAVPGKLIEGRVPGR